MDIRRSMRRFHGLLALLALTSCRAAENKSLTELRSDMRSTLSLASETKLFIRQIEADRVPVQFRAAHASYLREEALRRLKAVRKSEQDAGDPNKFYLCAGQLEALSGELGVIGMRSDHNALAEAERNIDVIRKTLVDAGAEQ